MDRVDYMQCNDLTCAWLGGLTLCRKLGDFPQRFGLSVIDFNMRSF